MSGLLWFSGITGDTPMRDIGWVWVAVIAAVIFLVVAAINLWRGNW